MSNCHAMSESSEKAGCSNLPGPQCTAAESSSTLDTNKSKHPSIHPFWEPAYPARGQKGLQHFPTHKVWVRCFKQELLIMNKQKPPLGFFFYTADYYIFNLCWWVHLNIGKFIHNFINACLNGATNISIHQKKTATHHKKIKFVTRQLLEDCIMCHFLTHFSVIKILYISNITLTSQFDVLKCGLCLFKILLFFPTLLLQHAIIYQHLSLCL